MTGLIKTRCVVTSVALIAGVIAPAARAQHPQPYSPRPHADFSMRASPLRIARFDASAYPRGRHVRVYVTVTARSRTREREAVLRIGRCSGGPPVFPVCEPRVNRVVRFRPDSTTVAHVTALVARPSARTDAIRISLTGRGQVVRPYTSPGVGFVQMLLPARAWSTFTGQSFGLRVARPWEGDHLPYDVTAVGARTAQLDSDRVRPTFSWTATAPSETVLVRGSHTAEHHDDPRRRPRELLRPPHPSPRRRFRPCLVRCGGARRLPLHPVAALAALTRPRNRW